MSSFQTPSSWLRHLELIHKDKDFLVVNKKAGVYTHPNHQQHDVPSVSRLVQTEFDLSTFLNYQTPENLETSQRLENLRAGIVHRLDRDTSGLMIVALTPQISELFKYCFKNRWIKKKYLALILGKLYQSTSMEDYLTRNPVKRNKRQIIKPLSSSSNHALKSNQKSSVKAGKLAQLIATPIEFFEKTTLIEVDLLTGRTHQIRVQLACRGTPILGDQLYHRHSEKQLFLCASELTFTHPKFLIDQPPVIQEKIIKNQDPQTQLHFKIDLPDFFIRKLDEERKRKEKKIADEIS